MSLHTTPLPSNDSVKKILLILIVFFITGCAQPGKKVKGFKHDTPLIKTAVKELGKEQLEKDVKMGPIPAEADVIKLKKLYGKEYLGIVRSTFVINPNGEILRHWDKVKVDGHAEEVLEFITGL